MSAFEPIHEGVLLYDELLTTIKNWMDEKAAHRFLAAQDEERWAQSEGGSEFTSSQDQDTNTAESQARDEGQSSTPSQDHSDTQEPQAQEKNHETSSSSQGQNKTEQSQSHDEDQNHFSPIQNQKEPESDIWHPVGHFDLPPISSIPYFQEIGVSIDKQYNMTYNLLNALRSRIRSHRLVPDPITDINDVNELVLAIETCDNSTEHIKGIIKVVRATLDAVNRLKEQSKMFGQLRASDEGFDDQDELVVKEAWSGVWVLMRKLERMTMEKLRDCVSMDEEEVVVQEQDGFEDEELGWGGYGPDNVEIEDEAGDEVVEDEAVGGADGEEDVLGNYNPLGDGE